MPHARESGCVLFKEIKNEEQCVYSQPNAEEKSLRRKKCPPSSYIIGYLGTTITNEIWIFLHQQSHIFLGLNQDDAYVRITDRYGNNYFAREI